MFSAPTQEAVNNWLNEHPEATTTVEDESLTYKKLIPGTLGFVTPEMFGAKGDGITDDRIAVQAAFDSGKNVLLEAIYNITDPGLILNVDNVKIYGNGKIIKLQSTLPDTKENSYPILIIESNNNILDGFTIEGDRLTHSGTLTEYRHCIRVHGNNAKILNMTLLNPQGDGITLGENIDGISAENTLIDNCYIDNARRNGISVINSYKFIISNTRINGTNGTNPQAGIDVEPNRSTQYAVGTICGVVTTNNYRSGILIYDTHNSNMNVEVSNCVSIGDGDTSSTLGAINIIHTDSKGNISINDCKITSCNRFGLNIEVNGTMNGRMLIDRISINGVSADNAAIRVTNNTGSNDLKDKIVISDYYCASVTKELISNNFPELNVSSINRVAAGTIYGAYVQRNGIKSYKITSHSGTLSFITREPASILFSKLCIVVYRGSNAGAHATFMVNGAAGSEVDRISITNIDVGQNGISLVANSDNTLTLNTVSAEGIIIIQDLIGTFKDYMPIAD